MIDNLYDIIIIGGGPAGLTAGIYAMRSNLKTLLIEEFNCGGQVLNTNEIKNYPGFEDINGFDFSQKLEEQAKKLGLEFKYETVKDYNLTEHVKIVKTAKNQYYAKTVILCMGAKARKLGLEREDEFTGRGVSYCAVCDGLFFKDKTVAVVGGGNSALEDLAYLTNIAKKTYLINRSQKYRAVPALVQSLNNLVKNNKVILLENSIVTKINGDKKVTSIVVNNIINNTQQEIVVDGLFIEIGKNPATEVVKHHVATDEYGYIIGDEDLMTNISGVFVAGDIRQKKIRQIITACADGAIASTSAHNFINLNETNKK